MPCALWLWGGRIQAPSAPFLKHRVKWIKEGRRAWAPGIIERDGVILESDERYKGPGHHSFLYHSPSRRWLIFYHRYENVDGSGPYQTSRVVAIDRVEYDEKGLIMPVRMTGGGVHFNPEE